MKQNTKNLICLAVFGILVFRNISLMKERDFWKSQATFKAEPPMFQQ